jgi:hypothetical protein
MKGFLQLEAIGYDRWWMGKLHPMLACGPVRPTVRMIGGDRDEPFVLDFSKANRKGSRGVMMRFALSPGLYRVHERTSWHGADDYTIEVDDKGQIHRCPNGCQGPDHIPF